MEKSKEPSIFFIPENSSIQLNFQSYHFDQESAVFIPSDQFIEIEQSTPSIVATDQSLNEYRYLFSQILTLGHISADKKLKSANHQEVLDYSQSKWKQLNPFNTTSEELEILFDTNEWLNHNLDASLNLADEFIPYREIRRISKQKLQLTFFQWKNHKLINLARQTLYESGGSIKETTHSLGFKDPAYFCRFFRSHTSLSPGQFVKIIEEHPREKLVLNNFKSLLNEYIYTEHSVDFYACELNLMPRNLSRIIKTISGISAKSHIESELIKKAQSHLKEGHSITTITFELGFQEVSHFSSFFKKHTGKTPSSFLSKSTTD